MHIHDVVTCYNNCPFLCACASTGLYYKNRGYENNTQYPFYTVAVKHESGELMTLTHSLAETKVQLINISLLKKKMEKIEGRVNF